jgi:RNA polymerase sigma-70 factor (ECF subfamily)
LYKTSNQEVAHDLTQETFLRLWKTISSDKHLDNPKSYIYQISRNLIVDYYKSRKVVSLDFLMEEGFDVKGDIVSAEITSDASILRGQIDSLEKEFREVIYLRFVEELGVQEIAQTLGISENLVSVRINRGKKKLNEKFK